MTATEFLKKRYPLVVLISLAIWSLLIWQHFNGGVPRHYILHRADLPSISNWWGALVLPLLAWILTGRMASLSEGSRANRVIAGLLGAFLFGVVLSVCFVNGLDQVTSLMVPGLLLLALFLPIYRAQYILGFILGMTYTFGAILPLAFAVVVGLVAFVIHAYIRKLPLFIYRKVTSGK